MKVCGLVNRLQFAAHHRLPLVRGRDEWIDVVRKYRIPVDQTALLLCDAWDKHWCSSFARRAELIIPRIAMAVEKLWATGVQVIHAASAVLYFCAGTRARERALPAPRVEPDALLGLPNPLEPLAGRNACCGSGEPAWHEAWARQHSAIRIGDSDFIAVDGAQVLDGGLHILSLLRARKEQVPPECRVRIEIEYVHPAPLILD